MESSIILNQNWLIYIWFVQHNRLDTNFFRMWNSHDFHRRDNDISLNFTMPSHVTHESNIHNRKKMKSSIATMRNPTLTLKKFRHREQWRPPNSDEFRREFGEVLPICRSAMTSGRSANGRCIIFRYCNSLAGKISGEKVAVDRGQPPAKHLSVRMCSRLGHICLEPRRLWVRFFIAIYQKNIWKYVSFDIKLSVNGKVENWSIFLGKTSSLFFGFYV